MSVKFFSLIPISLKHEDRTETCIDRYCAMWNLNTQLSKESNPSLHLFLLLQSVTLHCHSLSSSTLYGGRVGLWGGRSVLDKSTQNFNLSCGSVVES